MFDGRVWMGLRLLRLNVAMTVTLPMTVAMTMTVMVILMTYYWQVWGSFEATNPPRLNELASASGLVEG